MNWRDLLGIGDKTADAKVQASTDGGIVFTSLDDPGLLEYLRGNPTGSSAHQALFNTSVFRCCDLIASAIGALPFRPVTKDASGKIVEATDHPLFEVLNGQANNYQTSFEFKQLMQMRALVDGDGYARIVFRPGTRRVTALLPLDNVSCTLSAMGEAVYSGPGGIIPTAEVFHLKGLSWNGLNGLSRVRQAARAIGLAKDAEDAAINIFRNGMAAGGVFEHPGKLSPEAKNNLQSSMAKRYTGTENAGRWIITQEGMKAVPWQQTGRDSQQLERSKHQVEEVARVFGVPRPLMMVDDTSWGSGIEQLAILFVRFALLPWFTAWEGRGRMSLLTPAERLTLHLDFDERELLRGSMKDQAEFFSKALGGPGTKGWMTGNEVRDVSGLGIHPDGDGLASGTQEIRNVAS